MELRKNKELLNRESKLSYKKKEGNYLIQRNFLIESEERKLPNTKKIQIQKKILNSRKKGNFLIQGNFLIESDERNLLCRVW